MYRKLTTPPDFDEAEKGQGWIFVIYSTDRRSLGEKRGVACFGRA
jgi:hypothetical protein